MSYEVIVGDIAYEWSGGVYATEAAAIKAAATYKNDEMGVEVEVIVSSEDPRPAIWPSSQLYDSWLVRRK